MPPINVSITVDGGSPPVVLRNTDIMALLAAGDYVLYGLREIVVLGPLESASTNTLTLAAPVVSFASPVSLAGTLEIYAEERVGVYDSVNVSRFVVHSNSTCNVTLVVGGFGSLRSTSTISVVAAYADIQGPVVASSGITISSCNEGVDAFVGGNASAPSTFALDRTELGYLSAPNFSLAMAANMTLLEIQATDVAGLPQLVLSTTLASSGMTVAGFVTLPVVHLVSKRIRIAANLTSLTSMVLDVVDASGTMTIGSDAVVLAQNSTLTLGGCGAWMLALAQMACLTARVQVLVPWAPCPSWHPCLCSPALASACWSPHPSLAMAQCWSTRSTIDPWAAASSAVRHRRA
jgi:hypothetical protein